MPKFTAHFTVFTTENAHFHFALTTFLTQNAYISALLAALYEISVYEMPIYEMSVYEVSIIRNVHYTKCPLYEISVYEMSIYEMSVYSVFLAALSVCRQTFFISNMQTCQLEHDKAGRSVEFCETWGTQWKHIIESEKAGHSEN